MSLPKSRILSNTKGFAAAAEYHNNSPEQSTVVNVNVNHTNEKDKEAPVAQTNDEVIYPREVIYPPIHEDVRPSEPAQKDFNSVIRSKDNSIQAYSLLLEIIENNPLIINKQVIAEIDALSHLILFLTEADTVDVQVSNDVECSCIGSTKFVAVEKIFITKNNETLNFKYNYADANKFLSEHHVSTKFVVDKV